MTATGDRAEAVANADIVIVAIAAQFHAWGKKKRLTH